MHQAGMTKKSILVRRAPAKHELTLEKYGDQILELDETVEKYYGKEHMIFIDECTFSSRGFSKTAWSNQHQNITVEDRSRNQPCQAVCAAVCVCHGLLAVRVEDYSFDNQKFIDFLVDVRSATE